MSTPKHSRLLRIKAVAEEYLDCSVRQVWHLIALGHLEKLKIGTRSTRVTEESVLRFIESCRKGA